MSFWDIFKRKKKVVDPCTEGFKSFVNNSKCSCSCNRTKSREIDEDGIEIADDEDTILPDPLLTAIVIDELINTDNSDMEILEDTSDDILEDIPENKSDFGGGESGGAGAGESYDSSDNDSSNDSSSDSGDSSSSGD
jgi:hypothetical protein